MSAVRGLFSRRYFSAAVFCAAMCASMIAGPMFGQDFKNPDGSVPLPLDWSDHHLIYPVGYSAQQASHMQSDPRFFVQTRLHGRELGKESAAFGFDTLSRRSVADMADVSRPISPVPKRQQPLLAKDWSVSLGAGGVAAGMYPAKYVFDANAIPNCTTDFVVFPVNASTGSTRAHVVGTFSTTTLYSSGTTVSLTLDSTTLTLTASTTTNTGLDFEVYTSGTQSSNATTEATNLAAAINRNLSSTALAEVAAVASTNTVTVYALTAGTGVTLTDSNTLNNFSWGSVTAGTNGTQANIVGLNQLYSGSGTPFCTSLTYPEFTFSYASGVGPVATSPTLSLTGTQIAYVENDPNMGAILHVLTLASGTEHGTCGGTNTGTSAPTCATGSTGPVIPGSTSGSTATDYMLPLGLVANGTTGADSYSSPFINYGQYILYVGDNAGWLYAVGNVFNGKPGHVGGHFPVAVSSVALSSPVVDVGNTGSTFVGDANGVLYNVEFGGVAKIPLTVGTSTAGGVRDSPIVDSTNSVGYVIACGSQTASQPTLTQFGYTGSTLSAKATAVVDYGESTTTTTPCASSIPPYAPTLDNNYYTAGINSGTLTAVSADDNGRWYNALYTYDFSNGTMPANYSAIYYETSSGATAFSPLVEFYGDPAGVGITNVVQSNSTTVTITATNSFATGDVVGVEGVIANGTGCPSTAVANVNGTHILTGRSSSNFTFTTTSATITSGSCTVTNATATLVGYHITTLTQSGTTVSVTTTPANALVAGQEVTIAGVSSNAGGCTSGAAAAIDGEQTVLASGNPFTFTSAVSATILSGACTLTSATADGATQDYVFFSSVTPAEAYTFTLPVGGGTSWSPTATNPTSATGGTSGMTVDNDSSNGQASSIYFGTLATSTTQCGSGGVYCAVKLTQAGLQ